MTMHTRLAALAAFLLLVPAAHAAPYPTNACVGAKQKELGKYCKAVLNAWANWEATQNTSARTAAIAAAADRLDRKWTIAEGRSSDQGIDCADTTLGVADAKTLVDTAASDIATGINQGLNLGNPADAACGAALVRAAATKCLRILKAEGKLVRDPALDPQRLALQLARAKADVKFSRRWDAQAGCPTQATKTAIEGLVDGVAGDLVFQTTVSPAVDDTQFATYNAGPTDYLGRTFNPICKGSTPYAYFAKRGTVNKLIVYYQGGGACWNQLTCVAGVCDPSVITDPMASGTDNPNAFSGGFLDLMNPENPFRDWNVVMVPYCSCDVHFGDAAQDYPAHVEHRGYHNSRVVEKFAREHFVNPEQIFVTGSSAGAYGAWFNAPLHHDVWPASRFQVLADAGSGVITADFLQNYFPNWNFEANIPTTIPGVQESIDDGTGVPAYTEAVANFFPDTRWAHYTTSYDGGTGGQTGFYNIMLNNNQVLAALTWWEGSCAFNDQMRLQALNTAAAVPSNYRYYIGTGSRHTMFGSSKVYTDTSGGVPRIVDWVQAMVDGTPAWTNVECSSDCGKLLPGDPQPSPLALPFQQIGPDVVIVCSPSGAFLDGAGY